MCNNATVGIRRGSFEWEVLQLLIEKPDCREFRGPLEPFWGFGAELGVSLKSGDYVGDYGRLRAGVNGVLYF